MPEHHIKIKKGSLDIEKLNVSAIKAVIKTLDDYGGACKQIYLSILPVQNTIASLKISTDKADLTQPQERYHRYIVTQKKFNPDEFTVFRELFIILVVWLNSSSFFAQTIVLASAKLIAIGLSYILYSFISIFCGTQRIFISLSWVAFTQKMHRKNIGASGLVKIHYQPIFSYICYQ